MTKGVANVAAYSVLFCVVTAILISSYYASVQVIGTTFSFSILVAPMLMQ
uniref:Uncharacterized protein n=1 Tax=uncultured marine virus TaxID=186617 RepID=A0A0F7LB56_9VIRU|nr:hypothetical protein [uncultured marine virus]